MRPGKVQRRPREAGVALLLAVWILALLAVIGGELVASGRVRYFTELNRRDELRGLALALAGYHDALAALEQVTGLSRKDDKLLLHFKGATEGEPASREDVQLGDGKFSWRIEDEDGRMNLNKMTRSQIVDLLQECGMEIGVERDTVADSILDWRDSDPEHKLNGAEEDYYQGLEVPHSCKDGTFDVVEELLLVKGIQEKEMQWVFYGKEDKGEKRPGLRDLVTTFVPQNTQVNPASAPDGVLKAMKITRATTPKNRTISRSSPPGIPAPDPSRGRCGPWCSAIPLEPPHSSWYIGTTRTSPSDSGERTTLKYSLGASVCEGQLRLLCLRRDLTGSEVVAALRIDLPESADEETAFLQELAAFIIAGRIPGGVPVTLGVPRSSFLLRRFETPPVTARDLPELVGFEIERHLPGKSEDFLSGWRLEGRADGGGQSILLGAAPKASVERVLALLRRANLAPRSIQPEPFTLASCLRSVAPGVEDALVVDLGPNLVGFDMLHAGRLESSRVFPIDDPQWRESPAPAAVPGPSSAEALEAPQTAAERLGAALAERIRSPLFRESLGGEPAEIWVTGYGANRASLIEMLREGGQLPVRILSPWTLVRWRTPPADLVPFTHPLALALAGPHGTRSGVELAPERQETLHRAPSRRLTAVLAGLLVLVLAAHLVGYGLRQRRALEQADGEIQALKLKMAAVESVNRSVQEQRARVQFLESAISTRARQADVLRELTGLIPDNAYLSEFSYRDRTVEITGLAPSASQLLPVLETSPLFVGVEFSAPIVAQGAGLERFKIRMRLEPAGG